MEKGGGHSQELDQSGKPKRDFSRLPRMNRLLSKARVGDEKASEETFQRLVLENSDIVESIVKKYEDKAQFVDDLKQEAYATITAGIHEFLSDPTIEKADASTLRTKLKSLVISALKTYSESPIILPKDDPKAQERLESFKEASTTFEVTKRKISKLTDKANKLVSDKEIRYFILAHPSISPDKRNLWNDIIEGARLQRVVEREKAAHHPNWLKLREEKASGKKPWFSEARHAYEVSNRRTRDAKSSLNYHQLDFREKAYGAPFSVFDFIKIAEGIERYWEIQTDIDTLKTELKAAASSKRLTADLANQAKALEQAKMPVLNIDQLESELIDENFEENTLDNLTLKGLGKALDTLLEKDAQAVILRFGLFGEKEHTFKEIGEIMGVGPQRVNQRLTRALNLLNWTRPQMASGLFEHSLANDSSKVIDIWRKNAELSRHIPEKK